MLEDVFHDILTKRDTWIERKKGGQYVKRNPTAGDISNCARETALAILHYDARPPFDVSLLHRFECGDDGELRGKRKLMELGFDVVESQRMLEFHDERGRLIVRGKVDGLLAHPLFAKPILYDHKTLNPNIFNRLYTVDDCLKLSLTRKWVKQLLVYMFLLEHEVSFILLDDLLGRWRFIEVPFMEELTSQIIDQCKAATGAVEQVQAGQLEDDVLPTFHVDSSECEKCWARNRVCFPAMVREGYQYVDDETLAAMLDRHAELKETAKDFDALDKQIKKMLKNRTGFVVGNWLVEGEMKKRHMQAKPEYDQHYWQAKLVHLQEVSKAA